MAGWRWRVKDWQYHKMMSDYHREDLLREAKRDELARAYPDSRNGVRFSRRTIELAIGSLGGLVGLALLVRF